MDFYIYQAACYCDDCAREIRRDIRKFFKEQGILIDDDTRQDSDSWPQRVDEFEESDYPEYCDNCHVFLENPLTTEGKEYVIREHLDSPNEVTEEWVRYYGLGAAVS